MDITVFGLIATAILTLGCLLLIMFPIFKNDVKFHDSRGTKELLSHKEALMIGINEIEFEHWMDKISNDDFINLKKQYEKELVKIMKEEEKVESDQNIDEALLAEVEREIEKAIKFFRKQSNREEKK